MRCAIIEPGAIVQIHRAGERPVARNARIASRLRARDPTADAHGSASSMPAAGELALAKVAHHDAGARARRRRQGHDS
jgi:hypothetical protein